MDAIDAMNISSSGRMSFGISLSVTAKPPIMLTTNARGHHPSHGLAARIASPMIAGRAAADRPDSLLHFEHTLTVEVVAAQPRAWRGVGLWSVDRAHRFWLGSAHGHDESSG